MKKSNNKELQQLETEEVVEEEKQDKRLLILLIIFALTGVLLISSTYAWFTANRIVSVNALNVNVQAEGGIEISVDGSNWKTVVTQEEIENATSTYGGNTNQMPEKLEPVSTGGTTESGLLKMYYGIVASNEIGEYTISSTRSIEQRGKEGKFMAFDLFFKVDSGGPAYFTPETTALYKGTVNEGVQNAVRVAFVEQGNVPVGSSLGVIQGLKGASDSDVYIWEPNSNSHSATGISNALDVYGMSISSNYSTIPYSGIINNIPDTANITFANAKSSTYPTYFKNVDVDYSTPSGFSSNRAIWTFKSGITKMTVYIWIEGQDVDCENGSSSGDLEFKFQLTTNPA